MPFSQIFFIIVIDVEQFLNKLYKVIPTEKDILQWSSNNKQPKNNILMEPQTCRSAYKKLVWFSGQSTPGSTNQFCAPSDFYQVFHHIMFCYVFTTSVFVPFGSVNVFPYINQTRNARKFHNPKTKHNFACFSFFCLNHTCGCVKIDFVVVYFFLSFCILIYWISTRIEH